MTAPADLGERLARSRRAGTLDPTPLDRLVAQADAEQAQAFAAESFGGEVRGYVLEGAGPRVRARLGLDRPIWGPLLDGDLVRGEGVPFHLPRGVIGAGCGFAFVLGRTFPAQDEPVTRERLANALVTCHLGIQVLGRRVPGTIRLDALTATADFALGVAYCLGPPIAGWHALDLAAADLAVSLDGNVVARGERDRDPLDAVLWLAGALAARDRALEAGHVVATGSRVGILQVLPGQAMAVRGGALGGLVMRFA